MPPFLALNLVEQLRTLMDKANLIRKIPHHLKVLTGLTFFGSGSYQTTVGTHFLHPCSQPSVSRILREMIYGLKGLARKFIVFPKSKRRRQILSEM